MVNMHGIVRGQITAINPDLPVTIKVAADYVTQGSGKQVPVYETPGSIVGSITGRILTVTAFNVDPDGNPIGYLRAGQLLDSPDPVLPQTYIDQQIDGTPGGLGTYLVTVAQELPEQTLATAYVATAQIQPVTWKDLMQMEGLSQQGTRVKIYLFGKIDAIIRVARKGGDLITVYNGVNRGNYLVAQNLEQFPDWCSVACTLQNQDVIDEYPNLDFTKPSNSMYLPGIM